MSRSHIVPERPGWFSTYREAHLVFEITNRPACAKEASHQGLIEQPHRLGKETFA
jgi:hypothetical protein